MKEHPILFSAPMVRAILNGSKTQTRRIVKPQPIDNQQVDGHFYAGDHSTAVMMDGHPRWREQFAYQAARWQKGDQLWVKETHRFQTHEHIEYRADGATHSNQAIAEWLRDKDIGQKWKPSIFMPRWASRINLPIMNVRVERLQDITEADAIAEGVMGLVYADFGKDAMKWPPGGSNPITLYKFLWEAINGAGSWASNPWVWVVEFKKLERP